MTSQFHRENTRAVHNTPLFPQNEENQTRSAHRRASALLTPSQSAVSPKNTVEKVECVYCLSRGLVCHKNSCMNVVDRICPLTTKYDVDEASQMRVGK